MIGQLMLLDTGVTVILADDAGDGWYRAIVLHSTEPVHPRPTATIQISDADVAAARNLTLTDGVIDMLSWGTKVNGPAESIESLAARLNESGLTA